MWPGASQEWYTIRGFLRVEPIRGCAEEVAVEFLCSAFSTLIGDRIEHIWIIFIQEKAQEVCPVIGLSKTFRKASAAAAKRELYRVSCSFASHQLLTGQRFIKTTFASESISGGISHFAFHTSLIAVHFQVRLCAAKGWPSRRNSTCAKKINNKFIQKNNKTNVMYLSCVTQKEIRNYKENCYENR